MFENGITAETIALAKQALAKSVPDELAKAWTQSATATSGITFYDLEAPAKLLYPVLTPIRNVLPRVSGKGGIQANWRAISGVNVGNLSMGVGEGQRNAAQVTAEQDYIAIYRTIGLDDYVTYEAELAAQGFEELRALASLNLLRAVMIGEESVIIGGQGTFGLGQTATPTGTPGTSGAMSTGTHYVYCVALTYEGWKYATTSTAAQGSPTGVNTAGVQQLIPRTNMGNTTVTLKGGSAKISGAYIPTIGGNGSSGSVACAVAYLPGAFAYAWFWGTTAANAALGAITTTNTITIKTDIGGYTQLFSSLTPSVDYSQNSLLFDGLVAQMIYSGGFASSAYVHSMDGGTFTPDSAGGVGEINTMLQSFWENYRLGPDVIYCNSQEKDDIRKAILANTSSGAQRFTITMDKGVVAGGAIKISYYNPFSVTEEDEAVPVKIHPNLPPGMLIALCHKLPYPLTNVANVMQIRARRDYYQKIWPEVNRQYEEGVYSDEVLQHYAPFSMGMICNIGKS